MRTLTWKCRKWMKRKLYTEAWWMEHADMVWVMGNAAEAPLLSSTPPLPPRPPARPVAIVALDLLHPVASPA